MQLVFQSVLNLATSLCVPGFLKWLLFLIWMCVCACVRACMHACMHVCLHTPLRLLMLCQPIKQVLQLSVPFIWHLPLILKIGMGFVIKHIVSTCQWRQQGRYISCSLHERCCCKELENEQQGRALACSLPLTS